MFDYNFCPPDSLTPYIAPGSPDYAFSPSFSDEDHYEDDNEDMSSPFFFTPESLQYAFTHVSSPAEPPEISHDNRESRQHYRSLARAVHVAAQAYIAHVDETSGPQWHRITRTLGNLQQSSSSSMLVKDRVISQLQAMLVGDALVFPIPSYECMVALTKQKTCTLFESLELCPQYTDTQPLICSYPSFAAEIAEHVFENVDFQLKLANFFHDPRCVENSNPWRDETKFLQFVNLLRKGIICGGIGHVIDVPPITKRFPDKHPYEISYRSRLSLWSMTRFAIRMSLPRSHGRESYKAFILFFLCTLSSDTNISTLPMQLAHSMGCKILRRLSKLESSSIPDWLSKMALKACTGLREVFEPRLSELRRRPLSIFPNPGQYQLERDTQLSLMNSRAYIRNALENHPREHHSTAFHPSHYTRGTLDDFLSGNGEFFDKAYKDSGIIAFYDIEKAVEEGIDDWIAHVDDVDVACAQLEKLMDNYMWKHPNMSDEPRSYDPGDISICFLTGIELFVAIDKLVLEEIPMVADYSPEIPLVILENLFLCKPTNLHRLSCAYQYLSSRQSQSRMGWSALSVEDCLPARYYDQSLHHQHLKAYMEDDATIGHGKSFLPSSPLHAKVIVFELKCPPCIRIWRSAAARFAYHLDNSKKYVEKDSDMQHLLISDSGMLKNHLGSSTKDVEKDSDLEHFFLLSAFRIDGPGAGTLFFQIQFVRKQSLVSPHMSYMCHYKVTYGDSVTIWKTHEEDVYEAYQDNTLWPLNKFHIGRQFGSNKNFLELHTPNDALAAQVECADKFSLDEFITLQQLCCGGSLLWLDILCGLRSGTLSIRNPNVHNRLVLAVSHVGPCDLNTGKWLLHQELDDLSFCNRLLEELENLLVDVGFCSIDAVLMHTLSLLVLRILAASPSEATSERATTLLRRVRRKLFDWVQELCYNVGKDPINKERQKHLLDMSAACQSTFNADTSSLPKHFHSAEDLGAALSHTLLKNVLKDMYTYEITHLPVVLEGILSDVILKDASDHALDLVVCMFFPRHKPSIGRWKRLSNSASSFWLTCQIQETKNEQLQVVHFNLLDGEFRVEGKRIDNLEHAIQSHHFIDMKSLLSKFPGCFQSQLFILPAMESTSLCKILHLEDEYGAKQPQDRLFDFGPMYMSSDRSPSPLINLAHPHYLNIGWTIQMQFSDSKDIIQWIPSTVLQDDLPPALINGHIHLLNLTKKTIGIYTCGQPLNRHPVESWKIDCTSQAGYFRAHKEHETLVDIHSSTWRSMSKHFQSLHLKKKCPGWYTIGYELDSMKKSLLVTTLSKVTPGPRLQLSVMSPESGLSFFINDQGEFESHDFQNMVFDKEHMGTLFGIELLVLRQKSHIPEELICRRIIVPNGVPVAKRKHDSQGAYSSTRVLFQELPEHRTLYCPPNYRKKFRYHIYDIDIELGCLAGNGSMSSMQLLADMHTATNLIMPDPLTGKTGAQASSCLLTSGACQSKLFKDLQVPTEQGDIYRYPEPPMTLHQLFSSRPVSKLPSRSVLLPDGFKKRLDDTPTQLHRLSHSLKTNQTYSAFQQDYAAFLRVSAQRAQDDPHHTFILIGEDEIERLTKHYSQCKTTYLASLAVLKQTLGPTSNLQQELHQFGQWPPITGDNLLRCLASTSTTSISDEWRKCLIFLALILLDLQRARRLLRFALDGLEDKFSKELENDVCDGWNPEEYPDWLLIQIQGNFLIRRSQAEVAMEIISPKSGTNTIMQVNMGEGKTSVIIPIAATALADGNQLVRIIVPKALTSEMFEILVSRLGGLVNRPIYNLPFSRSPEYNKYGENISDSIDVDELNNLLLDCMAKRGILLMEPQHVASLKLMMFMQQIQKDIPGSNTSSSPLRSFYEQIKASLSLNLVRILDTNVSIQYDSANYDIQQLSKDGFVGSIFRRPSQIVNEPRSQCDTSDENDGVVLRDASKWLSLQKWMDAHIRDILDESDDILHPRFQLLYTFGHQQHIDGYPERWSVIQEVLQLLKECAHVLAESYPDSVEIESSIQGSFPHVSINQGSKDIGQQMIRMVVENVMAGRIPNLNFRGTSPAMRDAIRAFITDKDVLQISEIAKKVEEYAKHSDQSFTWGGLLLLRGLIVSNILLFAISERRWRVNYGFDHGSVWGRSTMLAVPYHAKDMPAPNTQFGHPDLTIILTCLSYYYSGLSEQELRSSFEILLDSDHMDSCHAEYARWIKDYDDGSLPDSLRRLSEINLRPSEQWDKIIFPLFTRNQRTINFYLSRVVFPKEMKEFPCKISVSSWDLAERRTRPITGFSGTNDIRWLLPMSIGQHDLDHQKGTNAKVLAYILQPENDFYVTTHTRGEQLATPDLLQMVTAQQPEIRVLLDVGAQVLDFSNHQVAEMWLDIVHDAVAAIYFNEEDQLEVYTRDGTTMPMRSSAISHQLGRCVVYIDHVHTRGTDLELPIGSRAAVTLGPKLTKDSLVQGCMRMRKLGRGHSVMFFAPPEVDLNIRALKKDPNTQVTSADILGWTIHETWADMQHWAPYWAKQGMDHKARQEAWTRFCKNEVTKDLSDVWLQPAIQTLEDLYAPREAKVSSSSLLELDPSIRQRCKDLGVLSLPSARMDEEQEREVQREREREREIELPPKAEPADHFLHPDVVAFVDTGVIPALYSSNAFQPIFTTLEKSSAAPREADIWSPSILATTDFCTTIKPESTPGTIDQYLRPVQWILFTERDPNLLVLISPFEANLLLPKIRDSECVHLHLYAPRTSKRMKPTDDLKFYVIPPLPSDWTPPWALIDQLNVFSGQLYLRDYPSYLRLCRFLGIHTEESPNATPARWNVFDLFRNPKGRESLFSHSPLPFVMGLLAVRTRGRPFGHTHMGRILYGQVLTEKDFDERRSEASTSHNKAAAWKMETSKEPSIPLFYKPPSPMDGVLDPLDGPEPDQSSGMAPASSKRKLDTAVDLPDEDSQSQPKRPRF